MSVAKIMSFTSRKTFFFPLVPFTIILGKLSNLLTITNNAFSQFSHTEFNFQAPSMQLIGLCIYLKTCKLSLATRIISAKTFVCFVFTMETSDKKRKKKGEYASQTVLLILLW